MEESSCESQTYFLTNRALHSSPAFYSQWKGSCHFPSLQGGCVFSQTRSGGGCTAENLMILSVCKWTRSFSPQITRGDSIFCFFRMLSLVNKDLMDVAAVTCVTEQLLFTAVCWGLTKKKEKKRARTHWKLPKR